MQKVPNADGGEASVWVSAREGVKDVAEIIMSVGRTSDYQTLGSVAEVGVIAPSTPSTSKSSHSPNAHALKTVAKCSPCQITTADIAGGHIQWTRLSRNCGFGNILTAQVISAQVLSMGKNGGNDERI